MKFLSSGFYAYAFLILSLALLAFIYLGLSQGNSFVVWSSSVGLFVFSFISGTCMHAAGEEIIASRAGTDVQQSEKP